MRDKNKGEDDKKTAERKALERRVDAMMDPKRPDEPLDEPSGEKPPKVIAVSASAPEPSGSSAAAKTAPQLSGQLRKKIGITDADTKPLSIDKLDELAEKISGPDKPAAAAEEPTASENPKESESGEPVPGEDMNDQSADLDDARTDEAVDDIVSHEGDVMLAVADATAAERTREFQEKNPEKKGHHVISTLLWTLVFFVAIVAVLFLVLLITGGNVTGLN